ncbi:TIGR04219 family outer membrane beta-barrel protein [Desulfonema magnum]|nr:TIGR04219 family outer membrane beta-barrel protein [Desulfonema magnum]
MKKLILLSLVFLFTVPTVSYAVGMELAIGGCNQSPQGDISYKSDDLLDLKSDLKYDSEFRIMGRLKLDIPVFPNIYLMTTQTEFDGTGRKSGDFEFGDKVFKGNTDFYSQLTLHNYDIALYYGIPLVGLVSLGTFNIDVGLNLRVIDFKTEVRQDDINNAESKSGTLPVPMLYVAARFRPIEGLTAEAELRGVTYSDNHLYSLIGRVKAEVFGPLFVAGGYRYESIFFDEEDVEIETSFNGPFFEAGFQF